MHVDLNVAYKHVRPTQKSTTLLYTVSRTSTEGEREEVEQNIPRLNKMQGKVYLFSSNLKLFEF